MYKIEEWLKIWESFLKISMSVQDDFFVGYNTSTSMMSEFESPTDINNVLIFDTAELKLKKLSLIQKIYQVLIVTLDVVCFVSICMKKGIKCNHQSSQDWNDLEVAWASKIELDG